MLYTKKGDNGQTSKFDGGLVDKDGLLMEVLGSLDEASAFLGVCKNKAKDFNSNLPDFSLLNVLNKIQDNLFLIQSSVAGKEMDRVILDVTEVESIIDLLESKLPSLNKFLKADGDELALLLNYERTLIRRAERKVVALFKKETMSNKEEILSYLNRLSDLFFVLYRLVNFSQGCEEKYF